MSEAFVDPTPATLDRSFFLARSSKPLDPVPLHVPEWGGQVFVKRMTAGQYDRYAADLAEYKSEERAVLLAWALVKPDGGPIFDVKNAGERATLSGLDSAGVEQVVHEFRRVNGMLRGN